MDLNADLCQGADYFDLIKTETEMSGPITPVGFIDSNDYIPAVTDTNNNLGGSSHKTYMDDDDMFPENCLVNANLDCLPQNSSDENYQLLIPMPMSMFNHWPNIDLSGEATVTNEEWFGEGSDVTALTNILDPPIYATHGQNETPDGGTHQYKTAYCDARGTRSTDNQILSSDRITTTYVLDNSSEISEQQNGEVWIKGSDSPIHYLCDDSLLRSALEGGRAITTNGNFNDLSAKACDMTELKRVLNDHSMLISTNSYPSTSPSPTSSSAQSVSSPGTPNNNNNAGAIAAILANGGSIQVAHPFYEYKVLDSSCLTNVIVDDAHIPNVEELIMTRIQRPVPSTTGSYRKSPENDRNINSTTSKWTYATPNSQAKPVRRRKKNNNGAGQKDSTSPTSVLTITSFSTDSSENSVSNSNSDNSRSPNSNLNGTTKKERCLHYCTMCPKGFKDKYSVNVHVRTHTGEKPFICTTCGKSFRQKAHLAKHGTTHTSRANGHAGKGTAGKKSA